MNIKIWNDDKLPTIDYRELVPFQGNLKDLDKKNYDKLKNVLIKRGFKIPVFIWRNPDDDKAYIMDAHQRVRVLTANDMNDNGSYQVPYVSIAARNIKDAREQLLELTSQYGTITPDGLDAYLAESELSLPDLDINFDAIRLDDFVMELDGEDDAEAPTPDKPKVPKYTTDDLRVLSKTYFPEQRQAIGGFLVWLDDRA